MYPKASYAWFAVGVLTLAYMFSFIDRLILSLLVEPIKEDLQISDVRISLLQGISFALFYTIAGIPIGRLVDSRPRTKIIAVGITLWSLMTAAVALTHKYWQLFLTRAGVGIGEATLTPAAYSMISDLFPPERRGLALGMFSSGTSIGAGLALVIGGIAIDLVNQAGPVTLPFIGTLAPWRLVFIYVGLPGLLVAALLLLIREPDRNLYSPAGSREHRTSIPLRELRAHYGKHARVVTYHHLGMSFSAMGAYGIMSWAPVMLIRTHGWTAGEVGLVIGLSILVAGTVGVLGGGWVGDALVRRGQVAGRLNVAVLAMISGAVGALLYPLQDSLAGLVPLLMLNIAGGFMVIGCAAAALLDIMPNRLRGQATAIYFFVISLAGIGFGPTAVALVTDYVFGDPAAVRYSLLIVPTAAFSLAATFFWLARAPYVRSLQALQEG